MRVRRAGRPVQVYVALVVVWAAALALTVWPAPVTRAQAAAGVTVEGPPVWNPADWTTGPRGSVTLEKGTDLTNERVRVKWSGFTPTVYTWGDPVDVAQVGNTDVLYAVRIYQCRGENPGPTDCYGSTVYRGDPAKGFEQDIAQGANTPEFPSNMVIAATRPDGTGEAEIELWTSQQSQTLGCDAGHACSLVVEANYGGDSIGAYQTPAGTVNCEDHSPDSDGFFNTASDGAFRKNAGGRYQTGESCAWQQRAVVPLKFAPTPGDCKAGDAQFTMAGLEMANRAVQQWRAGLCAAETPLNLQYVFGGGEPQARAAFLERRGADVALTARADGAPAGRPYVYAPLATSGVSVVFVVDDAGNRRQVRQLKLNARLMAKLLTQSYDLQYGAVIPSVDGNPKCVFVDPEFLALNPVDAANGPVWPECGSGGNKAETTPVVIGGTSDLVHQVTSWIAADPAAAQFLQGAKDPWGMRLNTNYLRSSFAGYPVESFQPQDFSGPGNWKQYEWNPLIGGLSSVARNVLEGRATCSDPNVDNTGGHPRCAAQPIGQRALFAIMDTGQAKAYSLPEVALANPAGEYVTPSLSSMQAAVSVMATDPVTGTQSLPYGVGDTAFSRAKGAYPLTTVQYAMLPTADLPPARAEALARFVRTVTDPGGGQIYGSAPGLLAPGFLALTEAQSAQAKAAAGHVAAQDAALPGNQVAPTAQPTPTPGESASAGATAPAASGGGTSQGAGSGGTEGAGSTGGTTGGSSGTSGSTGSSGVSGSTGSSGTSGSTGGGSGTGGSTAGLPVSAVSPGASAAPSAKASDTSAPVSAAPVAAGRPSADRAGTARLLLPVLLVIGAVLLVGGPATLLLSGTEAGARLTRRITGRG
ncbi:hypothetical protein ACIRBX_03855 [Kitasatospora sp. NPDC096147]|uniref:hypothetical protein n=1 Tax=Kitasatospora sp. NPDC096147 TaxID=3364093 RepID=UPI0038124C1A